MNKPSKQDYELALKELREQKPVDFTPWWLCAGGWILSWVVFICLVVLLLGGVGNFNYFLKHGCMPQGFEYGIQPRD